MNITAIIADTCSDNDCNGCCTRNANARGYLVDMEYWTVISNFGSTEHADGEISFTIANPTVNGTKGEIVYFDDDDHGGKSFGFYDFVYYLMIVGIPLCIGITCIKLWCLRKTLSQNRAAAAFAAGVVAHKGNKRRRTERRNSRSSSAEKEASVSQVCRNSTESRGSDGLNSGYESVDISITSF